MTRKIYIGLVFVFIFYTYVAYNTNIFSSYDVGGHVGYIYQVATTHTLPKADAGWSTFHPPLYYIIAAFVWNTFKFDYQELSFALQMLSVFFCLGTGVLVYLTLKEAGIKENVATLSAYVTWLLPSVVLGSTMVGNETCGMFFSSLSIYWLLKYYKSPQLRFVPLIGTVIACAILSKYSGIWTLFPCIFVFGKKNFVHGFVCLFFIFCLAGPFYLVNIANYGTPVPMTRDLPEIYKTEQALSIRQKRLPRDYILPFPMRCVYEPTLFVEGKINYPMVNVWGMAYASTWTDSYQHKIIANRFSNLCAIFGLIPLLYLACGFLTLRKEDTFFLIHIIFVLLFFILFTFRAPTLVAAKGSYLLPAIISFMYFFARGIERCAISNKISIILCYVISIYCAAMFLPEFHTEAYTFKTVQYWLDIADKMDDNYIRNAIYTLVETR